MGTWHKVGEKTCTLQHGDAGDALQEDLLKKNQSRIHCQEAIAMFLTQNTANAKLPGEGRTANFLTVNIAIKNKFMKTLMLERC